jgi:hypothetical protein
MNEAMDEAESRTLRREILDRVTTILHEDLAADAWGRILVEVVRGPDGSPVVAGIDVEEVIGDDARVDEVFGGTQAHAVVPVLGSAVEALCALDGLELEDVRGGTFAHFADAGFAWLPGLVHAPSAGFDRERDAVVARLRAKNADLEARYGFPRSGKPEVDLSGGLVRFRVGPGPTVIARATLIGTFAPRSRSWGWGGSHPNLPDPVRRASASVIDAIVDRPLWELSTPLFATDESTAWALAAFVCDRADGDGVLCSHEDDGGLVFFLLRDVRTSAPG